MKGNNSIKITLLALGILGSQLCYGQRSRMQNPNKDTTIYKYNEIAISSLGLDVQQLNDIILKISKAAFSNKISAYSDSSTLNKVRISEKGGKAQITYSIEYAIDPDNTAMRDTVIAIDYSNIKICGLVQQIQFTKGERTVDLLLLAPVYDDGNKPGLFLWFKKEDIAKTLTPEDAKFLSDALAKK